jgi:DNA polymerase
MYLGKEAKEVFATPVTEFQTASFTDYLSKFEKDKPTLRKWKNRTPELVTEWTNSWLIVQDFRAKNPKIIALWKHLDNAIRASAGDTYRIRLPSGRILQYRDVRVDDETGVTAVICRGGKMVRRKLYGGLLTENICSAIARDILRDAAIRLHLHNFQIIFRVHDELVLEVNQNAPIFLIRELMATCPPLLKGCPIDVEIATTERYKK